jgi:hypothetical protein
VTQAAVAAATTSVVETSRASRVPSSAVFADYVRRGRPVVITGATDDWPARRWSAEYFKRTYGDRLLPVAPIRDGNVVYGAEFGVRYEQIRFGEWLDGLLSGSPPPST